MFRNSFRLLANNFINVWKQLAYMIAVLLVSVGLSVLLALPVVNYIKESGALQTFLDFVSSIYTEPMDIFESLTATLTEFWHLILAGFKVFYMNYVFIVIILLFVIKVLYNISFFALGSIIDGKMSTYADYKYSNKLVSNFKINISYSMLEALISVPFIIAEIGIFYAYGKLANTLLSAVLMVPALGVVLTVFKALKNTLFTGMLPAIITDGVRPRSAFLYGIKKIRSSFGRIFSNQILIVLIEFAACIFFAIFTLGAGLIILFPLIPVLDIVYMFVAYYTANKKRYYLNENLVVSPL